MAHISAISNRPTPRLTAAAKSRRQLIYWVATAIMLGESFAGGILDLARQAPFYPALLHLGYPPYFSDILGAAKLLAVVALLAPGLPRLKEWAYSGIMINMIGAAVSQIAVHDGIGDIAPPAVFALIALVSWLLRTPQAGRPRSAERPANAAGATSAV